MALDKNDLLSLTATNKPDNSTGLITPAKSRQVDEEMIIANANLEELTLQTFKGPIDFPGKGTGYSLEGGFTGEATQPGTEDVPANVLFGAGGTTDNGHLTIGADGVFTVNTDSYLSLKQRFRCGRTGASGVSELFFWAEFSINSGVTWDVIGNSVDIALSSSDDTVVFFDLSTIFLPAGIMLRNRFARSSTGNNSGDLRTATPSTTLAALGVPIAPASQVTIYRINQ
jgi:hypothetical protein